MDDAAEHISDEDAAALLGVPLEQLEAMVDEGVLVVVDHEDWGRSFLRAEVLAVRNLGG